MARSNDNQIIEIVNPVCCGLDVHKKKVSACLLYFNDEGKTQIEIKEFETFTDDLYNLRQWLIEHECPIVAMESTGIYWHPVYNILEGHLEVILVNARHIKNVPGRKTDIKDSKWLAGLLRHGLLKGSFIPPKEVRQWRDLTRLRKKNVNTVSSYKKRVQKLFESANIKIDSVVSDLFGVSGRKLMQLLLSNYSQITLDEVEKCLHGRLIPKAEELHRAIQGFFTEDHRFILDSLLRTIDVLEKEIETLNQRIRDLMSPLNDQICRLDEIAGVDQAAAWTILSEVGPTLEAFPNSAAFCSWAGLCPANNESAGKRRSGRIPVRKHHLKTIMIEVAWAAVKKRGSYYKEKYYRLKARRGTKRAIVAIAHRLLKAVYYILKNGYRFKDLGEDYLQNLTAKTALLHLKKKASQLGYKLVPQDS